MAKKALIEQAAAPAEVPGARVHALPAVRSFRAVFKRFLLCRICFRSWRTPASCRG